MFKVFFFLHVILGLIPIVDLVFRCLVFDIESISLVKLFESPFINYVLKIELDARFICL